MKDYVCDGITELLITTSHDYIFLKIIVFNDDLKKKLIKQGLERNNES